MRILVVGTGGVGSAFAQIARRRSFFEHCALADYDAARPAALVAELDDGRFSAHAVDASSKEAIVALIRETRADAVLNSVDPLFNVPIFDACFEAGVTYLDMAMTLSEPHPTNPYEETGIKLGDYQFERAAAWEEKGLLALVGIGVEPGARRRLRALRRRRALLGDRRGRNPRRRKPRRRGLRLRPHLLDLDDHRGVPQPTGRLGEGPRLVHDCAVLGARGLRLPRRDRPGRVRERRARRGLARAAVDRLQAGDVQVRARRRVHRRAEDTPQARPRLEGEDSGEGASRSRRATSSRRRSRTRRRSATA